MQDCVSDFICSRIEDIMENLRASNGEYALAYERSKRLHEDVQPILHHAKSITISTGDCLNFRNLFEQEFILAAISQQELYRQGYLDCIELMCMLGLAAGRTGR